MIDIVDYALMAGRVYQSTRDDTGVNFLPVPQGWTEFWHIPNNNTGTFWGFEASYFRRGNEVVISYTGTGEIKDWVANLSLGIGFSTSQLKQAAEYYMKVKSAPENEGVEISFTGHSLGGGLASLMAVFFDKKAVTFDQAPFAAAATESVRDDLISYLLSLTNANQQSLYTIEQLTQLAPGLFAFTGLDPAREGKVQGFFVEGEILTHPLSPTAVLNQIGTQIPLDHGAPPGGDLGFSIELHSQTLLAAFLQSDKSKQDGLVTSSLRDVSFQLPNLISMIFDKGLYAELTSGKDENLIERLVRNEFGNAPGATDTDMLTRFTRDMVKLAQPGGLTMNDGNFNDAEANELSKTLIAFAMQKYYEEKAISGVASTELFDAVSGGIDFDMADVSTKFAAAFAANTKLELADAKGFALYFKNYLAQSAFTASELSLIQSMLPYLRDWYVQAGAGFLAVTDSQNRGAFMLGGNLSDALTGGNGADLLVGNIGNDTLWQEQVFVKCAGGMFVCSRELTLQTAMDNDRWSGSTNNGWRYAA